MGDEEPGFEIEHGHEDYSAEELLEQARANAQATVIATAGFLHARGVPLAEWAAALGALFARGWDEPRPWDAGEFLDAMLTNYRAMGAAVESVALGEVRAEAVTTGFPDPDLCALFGVEVTVAAAFNDATAAIAAQRGLAWTWDLDGARTRYLVVATGDGSAGAGGDPPTAETGA